MDVTHSESFKQPDCKSMASAKEGTSSNDLCYLEQLFLKEDFHHLADILHAAIWQRFSVVADEQINISSENKDNDINKDEVSISQCFHQYNFELIWNKENICTLSERQNNVDQMDYADSKFPQQTVATSSVPREKLSNIYSPVITSVLLSPWFMLSVVFTGCPKLLQHLLSFCVENGKKYNTSTQVNTKVTDEKSCTESSFSGASDISQFASASTSLCHSSSEYVQTVQINLDSTHSAATSVGQNLISYPPTINELVTKKIACEFPITDTWIHQSVNLMVCPLHLACWRLDFSSITLLLLHGADPNELALEQVPEELKNEFIQSDEAHSQTLQQRFFRLCDDLYFYKDRGLSPLHFIALGLRSPPRHSILEGCKAGIMHDTCAIFQEFKKSEYLNSNDEDLPGTMLFIHSPMKDCSNTACVTLTPSGLEEKSDTSAKSELVVNCLKVLLQAGANPNLGENLILKGAYPLDIILQPPTKVYYAPSAARGNQSSVSLRLQDLEHSASQVVAACETLLCSDAKLSSTFLSAYMWRPALLDCFHLNDAHNCCQLVGFLIRLGVFSDKFAHDNRPDVETAACTVCVVTSVIIHRFIADIMNTSISALLPYLILNWCSVSFLHDIIKTVAKIAEMSGWNNKLRDLSDMAISLQMRSLKHGCFYVILSTVRYSFSAVWSLPLPACLKRELTDLYV